MPAPILIFALSAAAKAANEQQALRRKQKLNEAMAAYQRGQAGRQSQALNTYLAGQTPGARGAELDRIALERAGSAQQTVDAVQASNPTAISAKPSADFQKSQDAAAQLVSDRTRRAIQALSVMGAPGEQAVSQGIRFGKAAGVTSGTNSAMDSVGRAFGREMENTVPNPWVDKMAQIGMAYGLANAGSGPSYMKGVNVDPNTGDTTLAPKRPGMGRKMMNVWRG